MECGRQQSNFKTLLLQGCALRKFQVTDGHNTRDQFTGDRKSKGALSKCVLCILCILSGSPNECWLHLCDACLITTWTLGLRAPLVARKNKDYRGTLYTGKKDNKVDFTENRTTRQICINI